MVSYIESWEAWMGWIWGHKTGDRVGMGRWKAGMGWVSKFGDGGWVEMGTKCFTMSSSIINYSIHIVNYT